MHPLPRGPVRRQKLSVFSVKCMVVEIPAPPLRIGDPCPDLKAFLLYERGHSHLAAGEAQVWGAGGSCTGAWPPGCP